jgi:serine/threonine protein kinase
MSNRRGAALVVGVSYYRHGSSLTPLPMARRDARALAQVLADPAVCAFPRGNVSLLMDEKAVRSRIVRRLSDWLPQQAKGADLAVIYFAGHGTTERVGGKEEGYLLPHDADQRHVKDRGIAMGDLIGWFQDIEAESLVIILDCCHAGSLMVSREGVSARSELRDLVIPPTILHRLTSQGRFLMASCGEGEKSIELAELGHGLFTHYLIQGIRKQGDTNGDGWVGLTELSHYVAENVERHAQELGHKQRPWTEGKWSKEIRISRICVPAAPGTDEDRAQLERLWHDEGPVEAIRVLQHGFQDYGEDRLVIVLRFLGEKKATESLPIIFRLLADRSKTLRKQAKEALQAIGWSKVVVTVRDLARHPDEERISFILEGLAALESDHDVVQLLDQLSRELKGKLRDRASFLYARKRAAQDQGRVTALFHAKNIPYELTKALGEGVYTTAYLGYPRRGDRSVVVRILRPEFASQKAIRDQFMELARRWLEYVHQNLARLRDFNCDEESDHPVFYVVRDYLDGPTLREVLQSKIFEPLQVVEIVRQVLTGLTPVHEDGRVHGGIRTSNLFILRNGRVVLGDPSLPLPLLTTDPHRLAFDYRYMPPETFGEIDLRSDFYSLGCVAYELACGRPPFEADDHHSLIAMHVRDRVPPACLKGRPLSPAWEDFLGPLLEKRPEERYSGLDTVLEALDRLATSLRPRSPSAEPPQGHVDSRSVAAPGPTPSSIGLRPPPAAIPPPSTPNLPPEQAINLIGENSLQDYREPRTFAGESDSENKYYSSKDNEPVYSEMPSLLNNRYELLGELGRGGMGVVYRARDRTLLREVAIKTIVMGRYSDQTTMYRFRQEAIAIAQLSHPNIVQILDSDIHEGLPYIVMELVQGANLYRLMCGVPMDNRKAVELIIQVADAIEHAHRMGILHRDIKPSNILMTTEGIPKLTDFGLAKRLGQEDSPSISGQVIGTPLFMAPEQASGRTHDLGPAVDIYALGAILYEMLTGRPPFKAETATETLRLVIDVDPVPPSRLVPRLARDLESICLKCLAKDPRNRYASAGSLMLDLRHYLESRPIRARPTSMVGRLLRLVRRNPVAAWLAALVLVLTLGIILLAILLSVRRP